MAVEATNLGSFSSPLSFHLIYIPAEVTVKLPPRGTVNPPKPININIHRIQTIVRLWPDIQAHAINPVSATKASTLMFKKLDR